LTPAWPWVGAAEEGLRGGAECDHTEHTFESTLHILKDWNCRLHRTAGLVNCDPVVIFEAFDVAGRAVRLRSEQVGRQTLWWMGSAFAANAVLAAIVLAVFGAGTLGTVDALQTTARFSFLVFWLAYASGGLALLVRPAAKFLRRHGRDLGLAFAAAHLVHILMVVWLCWIGATPGRAVFIFFVPPAVVLYVLALFSIPTLQQRLGRTLWTVLRTVGMTYIAYAFASDFVVAPFGGDTTHVLRYAPFAILSVAGPVLCALSFAPSLRRYFLQSKRG
jgi:hypothetical protein